MGTDAIVVALLQLVASIAPGVLQAITGQRSDAEAIAHAEQACKRLRPHPARDGIEEAVQELLEARERERLKNGG